MKEQHEELKDEQIDESVAQEGTTEVEVEEEEVEEKNKLDDVEELKKALEEKEKESKKYIDQLQRTMAEFDNFRKRTTREKAQMYESGSKETLEAILPVIDNFERALSSCEKEDDSFSQGVEMIHKQLLDILADIGVKPIEAVGQEFDPTFHHAVTHVEDESFGENEVIEEFQKGYMYKEEVLRYSMVKVAN